MNISSSGALFLCMNLIKITVLQWARNEIRRTSGAIEISTDAGDRSIFDKQNRLGAVHSGGCRPISAGANLILNLRINISKRLLTTLHRSIFHRNRHRNHATITTVQLRVFNQQLKVSDSFTARTTDRTEALKKKTRDFRRTYFAANCKGPRSNLHRKLISYLLI